MPLGHTLDPIARVRPSGVAFRHEAANFVRSGRSAADLIRYKIDVLTDYEFVRHGDFYAVLVE